MRGKNVCELVRSHRDQLQEKGEYVPCFWHDKGLIGIEASPRHRLIGVSDVVGDAEQMAPGAWNTLAGKCFGFDA